VRTTYNYESLRRHKVTEEEADEVYADGLDFDLDPSPNGNDRIMVVGWTGTGRLLEVGIEYLPENSEHIFHTSDATRHYKELFERR
jgi:hypothetical protein